MIINKNSNISKIVCQEKQELAPQQDREVDKVKI